MKRIESNDAKTGLAARELSAFIAAVEQRYGTEQARISAEDWLEELEHLESPFPCDVRNWRAVTIAASARLAERLSMPPTIAASPVHLRGSYEAVAASNI